MIANIWLIILSIVRLIALTYLSPSNDTKEIVYFYAWRLTTWIIFNKKKGKRKVQGVPQSQTAALPRRQEEEETDKSKQAQTEQTYEKH